MKRRGSRLRRIVSAVIALSAMASVTTRAAVRLLKAWFPVTGSTTTRYPPDTWIGLRIAAPSSTGTRP